MSELRAEICSQDGLDAGLCEINPDGQRRRAQLVAKSAEPLLSGA